MKKYRIYLKVFLFGILAIFLASCEKWIDPAINTDPAKPTDVSLNLLLPAAEAGLAFQMGGDVVRPACQWMQQFAGLGNQPIAFDRYNFTQVETDNMWKWGLYAGHLMDLNVMIKKAATEGSPHYGGVAKALMACGMGTVTDLWGDAPYSQAFQGANDLTPAYDSQEQIYATINQLLDEAITDLAASTSLFSPGGDDLIYGGDLERWTKAVYTLKARYALHLSKRGGATAYNNALVALQNGMTANSDDLEFYFGQNASEENLFSQFLVQRPGDITMCVTFITKLIDNQDPRLPQFADTTEGNIGSHPGLGDGDAPPIGYYAQPNSPVQLISYVEALFMKAECEYKTGTGDPKQTLKDAVASSLDKFGVFDQAWIDNFNAKVDTLSGEALFEEIMTQKWIALFDQVETFTDWRRTNYPTLTPAALAVTLDQQLPRRYPYPTSERIYNGANMPQGLTISSRVWWDVQ
jgi:hypothetical protein